MVRQSALALTVLLMPFCQPDVFQLGKHFDGRLGATLQIRHHLLDGAYYI
jgi:hypothetical protein